MLVGVLGQVGLHLSTLAPGVTTGDAGEIATAVARLGVIHPTGYPLFTLVGHVVTRLLPVEAAIALAVMNVVCAAVITLTIAIAVRELTVHLDSADVGRARAVGTVAGLAAGVLTGITPGIWRQVRIGEVYPLHLLLVTLSLCCWVRFEITRRDRWIVAGALPMGLGLAHHVTMAYLLPPVAVYLVIRRPRMWTAWVVAPLQRLRGQTGSWDPRPWLLPICCLVGAAPLLLYAYLPWATAHTDALSWGGVHDWDTLYKHATGKQYQGYLKGFGYRSVGPRLLATPKWWVEQFTPLAALPVGLGLAVVFRRAWPLALLLVTYAGANVAHSVQYGAGNYREYCLPLLPPTGIVAGVGLAWLVVRLGERAPWRRVGVGVLISTWIAVGGLAAARYSHMDRASGTAIRYLADVERALTPGSVFIVSGDSYAFPMWYAQHVQGRMRDAVVVNVNMVGHRWYRGYLRRRHPVACDPLAANGLTVPWSERCGEYRQRMELDEPSWLKLGQDVSRGPATNRPTPLDVPISDGGDPRCRDAAYRRHHRHGCACWDYRERARAWDQACVPTVEAGGHVVHREARERKIHNLVTDHIDERDVFERNALTRWEGEAKNPRGWNGPRYHRVSADYALVNRGRVNQIVYYADTQSARPCGEELVGLRLRPHEVPRPRSIAARRRPPYRGNPRPTLIKYSALQGIHPDASTESKWSFAADEPIRLQLHWFESRTYDPGPADHAGAPIRHGVRSCFYDPDGRRVHTADVVTGGRGARIAFPLEARRGSKAGTYTVQACTVGELRDVPEALEGERVVRVPAELPCRDLVLEYTFEIAGSAGGGSDSQ